MRLPLGASLLALMAGVCALASRPEIAAAQTTGGSLIGTVRDESEAVLPGATVSVEHLATGLRHDTVTSAAGLYRFPDLLVGRYSVRAEIAGFQTQSRPDVEVGLAATIVVDFTLKLAQVQESITVTGTGETLATSAQLEARVENRRVVELPLLGRDVQSLVLLAPGTSPTGAGVSGSGVNLTGGSSNSFGQVGTSFSSNGARARANNYQIDGIDINDPARSGGRQAVIQDAVEELALIQNNFSAEHGRTGGAIVNIITRSGTNDFQGSAFWFNRNRHLNALNSLDEAAEAANPSFAKPRFNFNQVGGSFGGPMVKNKTFLFGAYQYQKIDSLAGTSRIFTPTAAGLALLQAQVAAGVVSPVTVGLLQQEVPLAPAASGSSLVNGQLIPIGPITLNSLFAQTDHNFTLSLDHAFSPKDQLRVRFNFDNNEALVPGTLPQFGGAFGGRSQILSISELHTFSPTVFNEIRFGVVRARQNISFPSLGGLAEISVRELGLQLGPQTNGDKIDENLNFQVVDNLSLTRGRHFLKTGIDLRHIRTEEYALLRSRGQYIFNSLQDFATNTMRRGNAIKTFGPGVFEGRTSAFYTYVQDDIQASSRLTLNLGLRYEVQTVPGDGYHQGLNAEVETPVHEFGAVQTDTNNVAPRVGFAWSPWDERTVIRGGFGVSYDVFSEIYAIIQLPPEFQLSAVNTADLPNFLPTGLVSPAFPATPEQRRALNLGAVPIDNPLSRSENWVLGFQRELSPAWTVEARYVGTRGENLPVRLRLNDPVVIQPLPQFDRPLSQAEADALPVPPAVNLRRPDPRAGLYTAVAGVGNSRYHAGQLSLSKRWSDGYLLSFAYTVSRFRDNVSEPLSTTFATPIFPQNSNHLEAEWGPSLYDRTHRLVGSFVVEIPFERLGGPQWLTEGWQVAGVATGLSGQPYTVLNGVDANGDNQSTNDRVSFNSNGAPGTRSLAMPIRNSSGVLVGYYHGNPRARYLQLGALTGIEGTLGRNSERTAFTGNLDLTLSKRFALAGRKRLEFRAEIFNVFNDRQFGIPTDGGNAFSAVTSSFVTVSSQNFQNPEIGAGSARAVQLALRFEF